MVSLEARVKFCNRKAFCKQISGLNLKMQWHLCPVEGWNASEDVQTNLNIGKQVNNQNVFFLLFCYFVCE